MIGVKGLKHLPETRRGEKRDWTILGASRGEAGILGEGIRQALLRDQTYAPALAAYATGGGSPPIARTDLAGVSAAISPFVRQIVPIVLGFRSPAAGWLHVPFWLGLSLVFAAPVFAGRRYATVSASQIVD